MKSIRKNVQQSIIAKGIGFVFSFLSSIFLIRLLGAKGNGIFGILEANANLAVTILGFHLVFTLTYFVSNKQKSTSLVLTTTLLLNLLSVVVFGIGVFILFPRINIITTLFYPEGNPMLAYSVLLFTIFLKQLLSNTIRGYWQGTKEFGKINTFAVAEPFVNLVVFAGIYYLGKEQYSLRFILLAFSLVQIFTTVIKFAVFLFPARENISLQKIEKKAVKEILSYSGILYLTAVLSFLTKRIDYWILNLHVDLEAIGQYSLAYNLSIRFFVFVIPALHVISPYITASSNIDYRTNLMTRFHKSMLFFTLAGIFIAILTAPYYIPFLFGVEFNYAVRCTQLFFIATFVLIMRDVLSTYLKATNKTIPVLSSMIIALIILVPLELLLIPQHGILGAAYASIIAYSLSYSVILIYFIKHYDIRIKDLFVLNKADIQQFKKEFGAWRQRKH